MKKVVSVFLGLVMGIFLFAGCDSGGGGGSSCGDPTIDATGTWRVTETASDNNCDDPWSGNTYNIDVTQNDGSVSVFVPNLGMTFSGEVCENVVKWSGSYPEEGGTTKIKKMRATVSGNTFSAEAEWTWSDGSYSCKGTTWSTGVRQ